MISCGIEASAHKKKNPKKTKERKIEGEEEKLASLHSCVVYIAPNEWSLKPRCSFIRVALYFLAEPERQALQAV